MGWLGSALTWLPLAALIAVAVPASVRPSPRPWPRLLCGAVVLACGGLSIATGLHRQHVIDMSASAQAREAKALAGRLYAIWQRFDAIGRLLPATTAPAPAASFDTVTAGTIALLAEADKLEARVKAFRAAARYRTIDDATAGKMTEFLRPLGHHRVVVSCAPDDVEAYFYANRIATVLRTAGWEALGPEPTAILAAEPSLDVALYVRGGGAAPEAAAMLLDAFRRFNIPYQSKLAASEAIPDAKTVELFVASRPK
jgi:hypothetical protein